MPILEMQCNNNVSVHGLYLECFVAMEDSGCSYDLINVSGPLTVETILRTLQQRFNDGHCYVSRPSLKVSRILRPFKCANIFVYFPDLDGSSTSVCEPIRSPQCRDSVCIAPAGTAAIV